MSAPDLSVLDLAAGERPDPDEFVRAAMHWHFSPQTGSPFWLQRAASLDFDPRADVRTFDDLSLFPNVTDELRDVKTQDLIPLGFGPRPDVVSVIESGGTTGPPKRLPMLREFADRLADSEVAYMKAAGVPQRGNWLSLFPSGPHGAFDGARRAAQRFGDGVLLYGIDIDPRWVKKQVAAGNSQVVDDYTEHIVDQAAFVLESQDVVSLRVTAPVLARIARREHLVEIIREKVRYVGWGGASMDADSRYLYRTDIFPGVELRGAYGTTMALGAGGRERAGLGHDDPCIFDANLSLWVTIRVVDPSTKRTVAVGERGQVVVSHLSRSFLLPNNDERDTALRVEAPVGQVGDSFADVAPLQQFGGAQVVEGVY
ncbi:phenazine antibiotic biosynthesis protein [Glaciibacter superstes]|uniref:phenazine antibiotic biosynthesis protein n=1 Tax=Glaciibacter superstes TaxID=501023 RepID=UPI0003B2F0C1|nr:phenazine antibiotic biosynthesis protein [Glaciibacter superstes]